MDNPIFIVGLPRSGSTLWLNIFAQNANIYRMGEMLFFTPWRKDFRYFLRKHIGKLLTKKDVEKMVGLLFSGQPMEGLPGSFWRNEFKRSEDERLKEVLINKIWKSDKLFGSIFKIIVEEVARFNGYQRFCMKFPVYVNHIPDLLKWYPTCKVVHIIRDPRAMAISRTNDPEGTRQKTEKHPLFGYFIRKIMISFVVIQYIWTSKLHCRYKKLNNYSLFGYEDLLADPEKEVRRLCEFCGIDFMPEMLAPKEGQASSIDGKKHKGFNREAASRWEKVISPFGKKLITFFTRKSMSRFGYDPENHPVFLDD